MGGEPRVPTLEVASRQEWRQWLHDHHASHAEIWLVFIKRHAGKTGVEYGDAVEEALCYGWIDSIVRRLDDDRYAQKFTPRNADSKWSTANRRRYASLKARGLLAAPGKKRRPTGRSGDAPRPSLELVPPEFAAALDAKPQARAFFEQLAPSYRRAYLGWITSAKRAETKERRIRESIALLAAGKKLGMK